MNGLKKSKMKDSPVVMISQPRYLPGLNFLARISSCDYYVVMDNVQRTERGFENRNKIVGPKGPEWLTIPVLSSNREKINASVTTLDWVSQHKSRLKQFYSSYEEFDINLLNAIYEGVEEECPSYLNSISKSLKNTLKLLQIDTKLILLSEFETKSSGFELIDEALSNFKSPIYVSGVNGLKYGVENVKSMVFIDDNPSINYCSRLKTFYPYMSFLDCLFTLGLEKTKDLIKKNHLQI